MNTWLNSDIEENSKKLVDEDSRAEIGNLSLIFLQDQYFVQNMEYQASFYEKDIARDYYEGHIDILFPYFSESCLYFRVC